MIIRHLLDMFIPSRRRRWWMECPDVFPLLSEFMDEELDADFMQKVKRHVEDCPPCRNLLRSLETTKNLCAHTPERQVPQDFAQDLMAKIRQEYQEAKRHLGEAQTD